MRASYSCKKRQQEEEEGRGGIIVALTLKDKKYGILAPASYHKKE